MGEFRHFANRLILREWRESDVDDLYKLCSDPRVMEFLGPPQSEEDIKDVIERQQRYQAKHGHCFWAIELRHSRQMIGFCGIQPGPSDTPIDGVPEIGWRLAHDHWGFGYARESAQAALNYFWSHIANSPVWAVTVHNNTRSWGLMERLGMQRHHDLDFDHPFVSDDSPLKQHVTYSIGRDQWRA